MKNKLVTMLQRSLFLTAVVSFCAFAQNDGQDSGDGITPQAAQALYGLNTIFKRVVVDDVAQVFPGPADNVYQDLPGGGSDGGAFALIVGQATLVTLRFSAESQCSGGGTDAGWCGLRILVNGVEALPTLADFAFDSTNNGNDGLASWEAHAMERHLCVRNPDGVTKVVPVQVQWRVFSSDGDTTPPTFRLDDWSLVIESAGSNC
jgi:hypothetical protein